LAQCNSAHRPGRPGAVHIQLPPVQPDPHRLDPQWLREVRTNEPDWPAEAHVVEDGVPTEARTGESADVVKGGPDELRPSAECRLDEPGPPANFVLSNRTFAANRVRLNLANWPKWFSWKLVSPPNSASSNTAKVANRVPTKVAPSSNFARMNSTSLVNIVMSNEVSR
jgi:hypothetical protein